MITAFCPACWQQIASTDVQCPACGADVRQLDSAGFDEKLIRALRHPVPETCRRAAEILGRRRSPTAVRALVERWRGAADPYLGAEIARALGRIGGQEAAVALREMEADRSVIVQKAVSCALARVTREE